VWDFFMTEGALSFFMSGLAILKCLEPQLLKAQDFCKINIINNGSICV
jgi:hypothetical protein